MAMNVSGVPDWCEHRGAELERLYKGGALRARIASELFFAYQQGALAMRRAVVAKCDEHSKSCEQEAIYGAEECVDLASKVTIDPTVDPFQ